MLPSNLRDLIHPFVNLVFDTSGGKGVILAARVPIGLRSELPYCWMFDFPFEPGPNGTPARPEYDRIMKLEHAAQEALETGQTVFVGHAIANGHMTSLFYSTLATAQPIEVKTGLFKKARIEPTVRHDPEWSLHEEHLRSESLEFYSALYKELFAAFASQGDVATEPRTIDFATIHESQESRRAFLDEVSNEGYVLSEQGTWEDEDGDFWSELNMESAITPAEILPKVRYLTQTAEKHGGKFDGWACYSVTE